MGMENKIFWSETRSGFEKPGGKLPIIIPRSAPPPLPPPVDVVITDLHPDDERIVAPNLS